jgi:hypothetical protein
MVLMIVANEDDLKTHRTQPWGLRYKTFSNHNSMLMKNKLECLYLTLILALSTICGNCWLLLP